MMDPISFGVKIQPTGNTETGDALGYNTELAEVKILINIGDTIYPVPGTFYWIEP